MLHFFFDKKKSVSKIRKNHLSSRLTTDQIICVCNKSGKFTTKEDIHERLKVFLWRIVTKALPMS